MMLWRDSDTDEICFSMSRDELRYRLAQWQQRPETKRMIAEMRAQREKWVQQVVDSCRQKQK